MTATDELRRMLDELGVEHEGGERSVRWRDRNGVMMQAFPLANGELGMEVWSCTPEQAIAATLGSERETCHAESDLSEWVCSNCQCWIPLGLTPENIRHASEWRYCPHCGAKVKAVSDDER